jgi:hypothetical protein
MVDLTIPTPLVPDFWESCGYRSLERDGDGRLVVTDDFLRGYWQRPELAPVESSCSRERALHAALVANPRRAVGAEDIAALADPDARENYAVMLRFRERLAQAPSLEAFYAGLFRDDVTVPPVFVRHVVQLILRNILDGETDGLKARAAEVFHRDQRVTVEQGAVMLADAEVVEMHAEGGGLGTVGALLREGKVPARTLELEVLDTPSAAEYWKRDERHDTVLCLSPTHAGCAAFCRVLEAWIAHFHRTTVRITPVREIPDEEWVWHVGLDAEATAILNDVYRGGDPDEERLRRIVGLFRLEFEDPADMRADVAGRPVFLGLAMTAEGELRMKPQNLLVNLPLGRPA